jgi:hypothetical protein
MKTDLFSKNEPRMEPLALRPKDAAAALGISERTLWDWTHQYGLPHLQRGRLVLYPVDGIRLWLRLASHTDELLGPAGPYLAPASTEGIPSRN